jgi:radical SAM-linked protein
MQNAIQEDTDMAALNEVSLLVIKFKIGGNLRFLSHAQTLSVFQRACVRAGIEIQYSQGFNPRPRVSLPLPRPVGVESDDELLCIRVRKSTTAQVYKSISAQLPQGCELLSVNVAQPGTSFQPCSATYVLTVQQEYLNEQLNDTIERLLASESISVQRQIDKRKSRIKNIDVRAFLESIELEQNSIIVECKISSAGSIRVDEILELLELDAEKLASPIKRTNVKWRNN